LEAAKRVAAATIIGVAFMMDVLGCCQWEVLSL
jgi:hypothetical protein